MYKVGDTIVYNSQLNFKKYVYTIIEILPTRVDVVLDSGQRLHISRKRIDRDIKERSGRFVIIKKIQPFQLDEELFTL